MSLAARHYDNAADMLAGAHAVRMRLMRPRNAVKELRALPAPVIAVPTPISADSPLWMQKPIQFDAHVRQWEWQLANRGGSQRQFIARRCEELGLKYSDFVGRGGKSEAIGKRQIIWYELRLKFKLSYPQIADLSGGREHTSVMSGVKRVAKIMELDIPESVSDRARLMEDRALNSRMRREYAKGATQPQLAEKYRIAEGAIQKVAQLEKWPRECRDVAKKYDLTGIFDAYYAGRSIKEISRKFNVPERTLRGLRQRFGWVKRSALEIKERTKP